MLKTYVDPKTGFLNMERFDEFLKHVQKVSFFKRFDVRTLQMYLGYGKPKTFAKGEMVYLDGKIGVIYYGSVKIISHSMGMLTPYTEARQLQGKLLGHDSDWGISTSSQNWLFCSDDGTEIVFFEQEIFEKLYYQLR